MGNYLEEVLPKRYRNPYKEAHQNLAFKGFDGLLYGFNLQCFILLVGYLILLQYQKYRRQFRT